MTKKSTSRKASTDLFQTVTDKIIKALEKGTSPWRKPWTSERGLNPGLPANAVTGRSYSGINVMLLWIDMEEKGFRSSRWLTFKQAQDAGGNVRKGEKSSLVTLYKPFQKPATDDQGRPVVDENGDAVISRHNFMTSFHLFNVEQCENLPEHLSPVLPVTTEIERVARAEQLVACSGVPVIHRYQNRAFYSPGLDQITMPEAGQFTQPADYYSTLLHELVHSTGHASRLAREGITSTSHTFGDPVYGFEELVAEMGAAFLCAELGIQGDVQHDSYIASWLRVLKEDNRAVFRAARFAREAFEYLVLREQALAAA
ncbi:DNA primase [Chimaeribacter californicus]|uniref:DNA primase n=1 Tax=Chimaeribacter californicus TaxID=2060067 RepID=A0A2N5E2T0_9GAMM|nr:zincin-like metallopeptidase domain-containing protein [Chimaeribacter californicus]PLR35023.1 DNA primase [Chimaeribacter californicus]